MTGPGGIDTLRKTISRGSFSALDNRNKIRKYEEKQYKYDIDTIHLLFEGCNWNDIFFSLSFAYFHIHRFRVIYTHGYEYLHNSNQIIRYTISLTNIPYCSMSFKNL